MAEPNREAQVRTTLNGKKQVPIRRSAVPGVESFYTPEYLL